MNILITSAGKRVSLVRAFQNELKLLFPGSKVFTTDLCPEMSAACIISDGSFKVNSVTDENYIDELLLLCRKNDVVMIVPTIDTELVRLAVHESFFFERGINIIVSAPEFVQMCRDKRKTNDFFSEHGINTPALIDKENPRYPVFIKPYNGSLSADIHIVKSPLEMRPEFVANDRFMFMEYYAPEHYDEYTVDIYFDRMSRCRCIVPRKRISVRAGEINKGITCKNGLVEFLQSRFSRVEGARGCITAQFFMHKTTGQIAGIEVNARFGGGYPLSYHAGANYPLWLIREYMLQQPVDFFDGWIDNLLMLRYDDEIIVHANQHQPQQLFRF